MDGYNPLTQLHKISKEKDPNVFQSFVTQFENDLDIRDLRENTLLHWCCHEGRADLCKVLIAKHVNVNAANCAGDRPLHVACKSGQDEVVDLVSHRHFNIHLTLMISVLSSFPMAQISIWETNMITHRSIMPAFTDS